MHRLALLTLAVLSAASSGLRGAGVPAVAEVAAVQAGRVADLVLLDRGFDAGLREGMVCRLSRASAGVAEIQLVDLRPGCGSALILSVAPGQSIRPGDTVSIKVLKS